LEDATIETGNTDKSYNIILKSHLWFRKHVGTAAEYSKAMPKYCTRLGDVLYFDVPLNDGYTFYVDNTYFPTFTSDATECPISSLSNFVLYYVIAHVFLSIEDKENFGVWMRKAVGSSFDYWTTGAFGRAVQDEENDNAQEFSGLDMRLTMTHRPEFMTDDGYPWYR
jgi:hypothetical protein